MYIGKYNGCKLNYVGENGRDGSRKFYDRKPFETINHSIFVNLIKLQPFIIYRRV